MKTPVSRRLLLLAPLAFGLSACGDRAADPSASASAGATPATAEAPAAKPAAVREYPADYVIDAAIPRARVATRLTVVGEPGYSAADDTIDVMVRVNNDGKTALVGAGEAPVTLAVIDADGEVLMRKRLPLIPEGSSGRVRLRVPVAELAGGTMRIGLMQGGRSWTEKFDQTALELGPFQPCADTGAGYCGADGEPLAAR